LKKKTYNRNGAEEKGTGTHEPPKQETAPKGECRSKRIVVLMRAGPEKGESAKRKPGEGGGN